MRRIVLYQGDVAVSYAEYGSRNGFPILVQHGLIASICDVSLFQRLIDAGRRVICAARPGYGESQPREMRNIGEWGAVTCALADALGLAAFDVLGISSGAPYSYAIARALPERTRSLYILNGTPALYSEEVCTRWPYPINVRARIDEMQQLAYDLFFSRLSDQERAQDDIRDSMQNNCFGPALDLTIRCRDWGFRLEDVRTSVYMRHSLSDEAVPYTTAELTARMLPNCRLDLRENAPHFSQKVLDDFTNEVILKES
jgi:pimeloyl-ACP methyl ester carboxylesterase